MGKDSNKLEDMVNVGIGAVKTSKEVWDKLMTDLHSKKGELTESFEKLKENGERDFSDNALKFKVGAAWGIVKFDELKDNIIQFLDKEKNKES
ncbi:phasin-related domain-containing protein [Leptospira sp. GIMC2001]|uniref:phasin-related domain-containing protein n=1 Tax=Leptospira sp. GIMC2001 TaxID=1513297 RepID=UPI00234B9BE1|nr:hypothetical protein [Leptospira sp. GIMC2001]WCL49262.1 hypothetical protein O4O04_18510 [Leptospira sp. GIMC2001]